MNVRATLRLALEALVRNRVRSSLTMLGIMIGVAAVITTVSIGAGAGASVQAQISSLGSNLIVVMPGSVTQSGARSGLGGASTLTPADGLAIAALPGVAAVSPVVSVRTQVVAGGSNWQTTIAGVAPTYTFVRNWPIASGRFFSQSDGTSSNKVAVHGQTVATNLFADVSPIGKAVIVKGVPFIAIGTLSPLGQSSQGQDQDDTILMPYTSAMQRLTGLTTVNQLMVTAVDGAHVDAVQQELTLLLQRRHAIVAPQPNDFQVRNLQSVAAAASSTSAVMEFLLAGVAFVSLIVGGIGIMNIMMVSVTERTREIGLRMALGANRTDVVALVLRAASWQVGLGLAIGIPVALLGGRLMSSQLYGVRIYDPLTIGAAVLVLSAFAAIAGFIPARRAASIEPMNALRTE